MWLLLPYLEGSWIIILSSALIGCFTVRLNVDLCSDWLFYSAAHFISSHSRKETQGNIYISKLYCTVISLGNYTVNKMRASGIRCNMLLWNAHSLLVSLSRFAIGRSLFILWSSRVLTTHFTRSDACQWCSGSVNHFAIILSHLSLLCLCGKWNLMYYNVAGYR